jgi:hypothetical protein
MKNPFDLPSQFLLLEKSKAPRNSDVSKKYLFPDLKANDSASIDLRINRRPYDE